jgi:hypothetical protein
MHYAVQKITVIGLRQNLVIFANLMQDLAQKKVKINVITFTQMVSTLTSVN